MSFKVTVVSALVCILVGCGYDQKDLDFTPAELAFTEPYHVDDTLYFEDKAMRCDTVIIKSVGKDQNFGRRIKDKTPAFNRIWVTAEHLQSDYWRGATKNSSGNKDVTFQNIIMVEKLPKTHETNIAIEFRNFSYSGNLERVGQPDTTPVNLGKKSLTAYYLFVNKKLGSATDSTNITAVYWTPKEGLVAYKTASDNLWVLREHHK